MTELERRTLGRFADEIDREASISSRPGQLDRLEAIATQLRDLAPTPESIEVGL